MEVSYLLRYMYISLLHFIIYMYINIIWLYSKLIACYRGGQLPNNRNDIANLRWEVADLEAKENTLESIDSRC